MASKFALNASLTEHLHEFVAGQVASGRFGTASEVVRAALRLLERDLGMAGSVDQPSGIGADPAAPSAGRAKAGRIGTFGKAL